MSEGNSLVTIVVTKSGESETQVGILFCTRDEEAIGTYESVYNSATSLIPRLLKRSLGMRLSAATIYCTEHVPKEIRKLFSKLVSKIKFMGSLLLIFMPHFQCVGS